MRSKDTTFQLFMVIILMITSLGVSTPKKIMDHGEFYVSGVRGAVYYRDQFNQLQPIKSGDYIPRDTYIQVGVSPKGPLDLGKEAEIYINSKWTLRTIKHEKENLQIEGVIQDILLEHYPQD